MGTWVCNGGFCESRCAPECTNDCQCGFDQACIGLRCEFANRNNLCCFSPTCFPGDFCVFPDGRPGQCPDADGGIVFPDGGPPRPDAGLPGPDGGPIPDGVSFDAGNPETPVGAACMSAPSCGPGFCIDESQGFPGGYCSEACGVGPGGNDPCPGDAICRPVGGGQAFCLDGCASPMECRAGYNCVQLGLNTNRVCWPVPPGSTNPNGAPVGSACMGDQQCATGLVCLDEQSGFPGGYCTRIYCDPQTNPCPQSSLCYAFPGLFSMCLETCPSGGSRSTCRPRYYCLGPTGQPGVCVAN
jgi:hypothetical protein